jgi:regulator of nonsense transcripts 1
MGPKRATYASYASSIISQDVAGAPGGTDASSVAGSQFDPNSSIVFSQSDRLRRRNSLTSMAGTSDVGSLSVYDYKSQDSVIDADDSESQYSHSVQSGVTEF